MSFFKKIGKGIKRAGKWVGKTTGKVLKTAGTVASVVPGLGKAGKLVNKIGKGISGAKKSVKHLGDGLKKDIAKRLKGVTPVKNVAFAREAMRQAGVKKSSKERFGSKFQEKYAAYKAGNIAAPSAAFLQKVADYEGGESPSNLEGDVSYLSEVSIEDQPKEENKGFIARLIDAIF